MKKLIVIALLVQTALSAYAQATPGTPAPRPPGAGSVTKITDTTRFEIVFPGGTPRDLIAMLDQAVGPEANVIIAPTMEKARIPAFTLRNVTLSDVFMALNSLTDSNNSGMWTATGSAAPVWVLNPTPPKADPFQQRLNTVANPPKREVCDIFPVSHFLTTYKVEDITTAVQTAWSMQEDASGATLKFHVDTGLLIAVGPVEKVAIVKSVLSSLEQNIARKEAAHSAATSAGKAPTAANSSAAAPSNK